MCWACRGAHARRPGGGRTGPEVLAELARGRLRKKIPEQRAALRGRFKDHHALLIGLILDHTDHLEGAISAVDARVEEVMAPFVPARDHLDSIAGVGKRVAECIIAEIGVDMTQFPTAGHLASWAGMARGTTSRAANATPAIPPKVTSG